MGLNWMSRMKFGEKKPSKNKTVVQDFNEHMTVSENSWNSGKC